MPHTLATAAASDFLIRKSRFIGCVQPIADRASARRVVAALREQHPDAAHVCWALLAGGQSAAVDDGEPSGTAGRPMLDVLRHQQLEGVLATVVRYFGGVKLGAGGLVRAYTDCIAQALQQATKIPIVRLHRLSCSLPYALEGLLRREVESAGGQWHQILHAEQVMLSFSLAESAVDAFVVRISEAGQGRVTWLTDTDSDGGLSPTDPARPV